MATRIPPRTPSSQVGVRSGAGNNGDWDGGTVFRSMKEFLLWVIIVTLMIFIMFALFLSVLYVDKQVKKTEAMLIRLEEKEKKNAKPRIDPEPVTE